MVLFVLRTENPTCFDLFLLTILCNLVQYSFYHTYKRNGTYTAVGSENLELSLNILQPVKKIGMTLFVQITVMDSFFSMLKEARFYPLFLQRKKFI